MGILFEHGFLGGTPPGIRASYFKLVTFTSAQVGIIHPAVTLESHKFYDDYMETRQDGSKTGSSGKKTNGNPVLRGMPKKGNFYVRGDDVVYSLYGRVFIKRKIHSTHSKPQV